MGSEERTPKPPFTFDKEDVTGTNPKIKVIDANGIRWNVKFDDEVNSEVASARLVWACGYMVEESYFVRSGTVAGVKSLDRAKKFVGADGAFTNAMFERRPDDIARRNIRWSWESNPFVGSKELSGLAILVAMLNNYDAKIENNNVLGMYGDDKSSVNDWYILSDWGASFGKTGGVFSQSKWDLKDFASQAFIDGVSGGSLKLHYSGKMGRSMRTVPIDHAKWFAGRSRAVDRRAVARRVPRGRGYGRRGQRVCVPPPPEDQRAESGYRSISQITCRPEGFTEDLFMRVDLNDNWKRRVAPIILAALFAVSASAICATPSAGLQKDKEKKGKKSKISANAPQTAGTPSLWQDPGDVSKLNLSGA